MHVFYDCGNYNNLQQNTIKKIKGNWFRWILDTGNKLQKLKGLQLDGSLKSVSIFVQYAKKFFLKPIQPEQKRAYLICF